MDEVAMQSQIQSISIKLFQYIPFSFFQDFWFVLEK